MNIRQQGNHLLIEFYLDDTTPAIRLKNSKVIACTQQYIDAVSLRPREGDETGTVTTKGTAYVAIDIRKLEQIAWRASRNRSRKAQQGAARADFSGIRQFIKSQTDENR